MDASNSDVFLSHNEADKPVVEEIARRLLDQGIKPWLDKWDLIAGEPWQEAIENALRKCATCAVFIGSAGYGPWHSTEMRSAIQRRVEDKTGKFRVFPVFLPNARRDGLPDFLMQHGSVEFRKSIDDEEDFRLLVCGIQGRRPGPGGGVSSPYAGTCPYRGLQVFDVENARFFFGRESLQGRLLNKIPLAVGAQQQLRFVGVLGPSGSGKSSLVRAGLIAGLREEALPGSARWPIAICRPGADPLESLAMSVPLAAGRTSTLREVGDSIAEMTAGNKALHRLTRLALLDREPQARFVIFVDQFEETFTVCAEEKVRQAFIENLLYAAGVIDGRTLVVLATRSDFYGKCAAYPGLASAFSENQLLVGPMSRGETNAAITTPATLTGCHFDEGLVERLLDDCEKESGALPLLQHALLQLWEKRDGGRLTFVAYAEIEGIEGALRNKAEEIFKSLRSDEERNLCRDILLQLINLGEDGKATKRRVPKRELFPNETGDLPQSRPIDEIIERLAAPDARLLTTGALGTEHVPTIEISHEALIRSWGRLKDWIEENRQDILIERALADTSEAWQKNGRGEEYLFRGSRLAKALEWSERHRKNLNASEREFLQVSTDQAAEDSRSSDAATLDHLEAVARQSWSHPGSLSAWLARAKSLIVTLPEHRRQLDRYHPEGSDGPAPAGEDLFSSERQFRADTLRMLILRMERFRDGLLRAAEHRESVDLRLADLTLARVEAKWTKAIRAIADPAICPEYAGLVIKPQLGLIPIGQDPVSRLWEFAHLQTGLPTPRLVDGALALNILSGCILVLMPPGTFQMGAVRPTDALPLGAPHVDPYALDEESPVNPTMIRPFFMGKHQMTQGQWLVAAGHNPSMFRPEMGDGVSLLHPVECVSWDDCVEVFQSVGLRLPTEAQWEYAARAGTSSIWWTGNDGESLARSANIMSTSHVAVGSMRAPNPFGLHDILGNVWEWCKDWYGPYTAPVSDSDAERLSTVHVHRVSRGGSFFNTPSFARSAIRYFQTVPGARFNNRGVRAARDLVE